MKNELFVIVREMAQYLVDKGEYLMHKIVTIF